MNTKAVYIMTIIVFAILFIWVYVTLADFTPDNKEDKLLKKINELELKIDSLNNKKNDIRSVIDSTHVKIITNEKHYQERIHTIIHQPASADSSFVTDYIRQYADKNSLFDTK